MTGRPLLAVAWAFCVGYSLAFWWALIVFGGWPAVLAVAVGGALACRLSWREAPPC